MTAFQNSQKLRNYETMIQAGCVCIEYKLKSLVYGFWMSSVTSVCLIIFIIFYINVI